MVAFLTQLNLCVFVDVEAGQDPKDVLLMIQQAG